MTQQVWRVDADDATHRLAKAQLGMARNARFEAGERARQRAARLVSILGGVASCLALYDLLLLAHGGH